jgi:hypothetical protein
VNQDTIVLFKSVGIELSVILLFAYLFLFIVGGFAGIRLAILVAGVVAQLHLLFWVALGLFFVQVLFLIFQLFVFALQVKICTFPAAGFNRILSLPLPYRRRILQTLLPDGFHGCRRDRHLKVEIWIFARRVLFASLTFNQFEGDRRIGKFQIQLGLTKFSRFQNNNWDFHRVRYRHCFHLKHQYNIRDETLDTVNSFACPTNLNHIEFIGCGIVTQQCTFQYELMIFRIPIDDTVLCFGLAIAFGIPHLCVIIFCQCNGWKQTTKKRTDIFFQKKMLRCEWG